MSDLFEQLIHTVDDALSDKDELVHKEHYDRDHIMLIIRNLLVGASALLFLISFVFDEISHIDIHHILKGIAYFCGAGAYVFECLLLTDCFKTKVPHKEMFMVYCLGPLYLLMGFSYMMK